MTSLKCTYTNFSMETRLTADSFMGYENYSPVELTEALEMDQDFALPSIYSEATYLLDVMSQSNQDTGGYSGMDSLPATEPITDIIQDTYPDENMSGFPSSEIESHPQLDTSLEREAGAETEGADTRRETQGAEEQRPELYSSPSWNGPERKLFDPIEIMDPESWDHYFSAVEAERHAEQEARERPFPCPRCGKRYKTKKYLAEHIRGVHVREVRFTCGICGKGFFWQADFKIHKQRKMPCKPAKSPVAPLPTTIPSACHLSNQEEVQERLEPQNDERPFRCPNPKCGKSYKTKGALSEHFRGVHQHEIRWNCARCGRGFFFHSAYYSHQNLKTPCAPKEVT
jgi:hypothetical protein